MIELVFEAIEAIIREAREAHRTNDQEKMRELLARLGQGPTHEEKLRAAVRDVEETLRGDPTPVEVPRREGDER